MSVEFVKMERQQEREVYQAGRMDTDLFTSDLGISIEPVVVRSFDGKPVLTMFDFPGVVDILSDGGALFGWDITLHSEERDETVWWYEALPPNRITPPEGKVGLQTSFVRASELSDNEWMLKGKLEDLLDAMWEAEPPFIDKVVM